LEHLQQSYTEIFDNITKAPSIKGSYDGTNPQIINDCLLSDLGNIRFYDNYLVASSKVGFTIDPYFEYLFTAGMQIRVTQDAGYTHEEYNTDCSVTGVTFSGTYSIVMTDVNFAGSTEPEPGFIGISENADKWRLDGGSVKYNSDIYLVDSFSSLTISTPDVPVCYIVTDYISQDPIKLSDDSYVNVHQIKKIVVEAGTSGEGGSILSNYEYLCDFSDLEPTPSLKSVWPLAIETEDITNFAIIGETGTDIPFTYSITHFGVTHSSCKINQFNEYTMDVVIFHDGLAYVNAGFQKIATLPSNLVPSFTSKTDYISSCILQKATVSESVPMKIEANGDLYFYNPTAGGLPIINIHIKYEL